MCPLTVLVSLAASGTRRTLPAGTARPGRRRGGSSARRGPYSARMTRLPALDGLRAVAALLVVLTHAAYLTGFTVHGGLPGRVAGRGDFGVAIFFALSGFLLHHQLVSDAGAGRTDLRAYAARRAARVLPAYWVALAVVVVLAQPPVRTVVAQAFALQIYVPGTDIDEFSQSWSISTEISFYIALPFVVLLLGLARRRHPDLPVALLIGSAVLSTVFVAVMPVGVVGPGRARRALASRPLAQLRRRDGPGRGTHAPADAVRGKADAPGARHLGLPRPRRRGARSRNDADRGTTHARARLRGTARHPAGLVLRRRRDAPRATGARAGRRVCPGPRPRGRLEPWAPCRTASSCGTCRSSLPSTR